MIDLSAAGLSPTESKSYQALLTRKEWLPSELAKNVSETRTNMYKILDKLTSLGLAEKFDKNKKIHYRATNPTHLLELARSERMEREKAEKELNSYTKELMHQYVRTNEQAGVRFFQGEAEIKKVFQEIAKAEEEVVFIHTKAGADYYGFDIMHNLRMLAVKKGVQRRALTPDNKDATKDYAKTDPLFHLERTWFGQNDYTLPVEWGAFDDKLYIISYGDEALGMIIESKPIADSFKQLFKLLERGQRALPEYASLPALANKRAKT